MTFTVENAPWWTRAVVYQIYPRSFADSNGDGVGDIGGIRSRLDHLADLGVDVLWLSPIYPSPQHDNGYDISDYRDIDPRFGDLAQFEALLREVHVRGMKLVMDLVVNHTSDEHPWFIESRSSTDNPKRDWYWWRTPSDKPGQPLPNDWTSAFSGPAWTLDETTGEYYLHLFARQQPDLNWENPEVRHAVYDMMRWWLDRGVDGFRMDVINLIAKIPELIDGPSRGGGSGFRTGPQLDDYLQEMHREVFAGRDAQLITVGEMPGVTVDAARLITDPARDELDMVFQFEHMDIDRGESRFDAIPLDLVALKANLTAWQVGLADVGWNSLYLGNHDQPRTVSRYGDDAMYRRESATLWATILHLHRGTPYIYQGDEIGMTNVPFASIDDYRDIESLRYYDEATSMLGQDPVRVLAGLQFGSRDNARTPVQWDASPNAGFTAGTPWIGLNPNYQVVNVAADRDAGFSVFDHFRALIALRHDDPVVQLGAFQIVEPSHPTLYAFTRTLGEEQLLVVGNVSGEPLDVPLLAEWAAAQLVLSNHGADAAATVLGPWEARILRRR